VLFALLCSIDGKIKPKKAAATIIPPANPKIIDFAFGPKFFRKKKTNEDPIAVENRVINKQIIKIKTEYSIKAPF